MKQLVLIRHGETPWDDDSRIQGTLDIPLNNKGIKEAEDLCDNISMPLDVIYSSSLSRAYDTAFIIASKMDIKVKKVKELNELDHGLWQGLKINDVKKRYAKIYSKWENSPVSVTPPQGESIPCAYDRVINAVHKITDKNSSGNICIVSHKIIIALIKSYYLHLDLDKIWEILSQTGMCEILKISR